MNIGVGCKYKIIKTIDTNGDILLPGRIVIIEHMNYRDDCIISIDAKGTRMRLAQHLIYNRTVNVTDHRRRVIREYYNSKK